MPTRRQLQPLEAFRRLQRARPASLAVLKRRLRRVGMGIRRHQRRLSMATLSLHRHLQPRRSDLRVRCQLLEEPAVAPPCLAALATLVAPMTPLLRTVSSVAVLLLRLMSLARAAWTVAVSTISSNQASSSITTSRLTNRTSTRMPLARMHTKRNRSTSRAITSTASTTKSTATISKALPLDLRARHSLISPRNQRMCALVDPPAKLKVLESPWTTTSVTTTPNQQALSPRLSP